LILLLLVKTFKACALLDPLSELLCTRDAVYTFAACMDRGRRFTSQFQRMNTMNRKE